LLQFDRNPSEPAGRSSLSRDSRILGFPREVAVVEVEEVVVADARSRRPPGHHVPDGLEHAAGRNVPTRKIETRRAVQDIDENAVLLEHAAKSIELLVDWLPAGVHRGAW